MGKILLSLVAAFAFATAALSSNLVTAGDPQAILNIAKGYGSAELSTDNVGDPQIIGRIDGTRYAVTFYGCDGGENCRHIRIHAHWAEKMSFAQANEWNAEKLFGKAYVDSDGDAALEMVVNLYGGVSRQNLDDTFDWWKVALNQFVEFIETRA